MFLTDTDINKLLNKEIVIDPCDDNCITPVGYNLRIGDFVYSLDRGLLNADNSGKYTIRPGEIILVLTKEFVWVSNRIGGTFHSKVKLVSFGFSHISTTLDPGWGGKLLITMCNMSKRPIILTDGQSFATLVFLLGRSRATKSQDNPPSQIGLILQLLTSPSPEIKENLADNQIRMMEKYSEFIQDNNVKSELERRLTQANQGAINSVTQAIKSQVQSRGLTYLYILLHILLLAVLILLPVYFDQLIKPLSPQILGRIVVDNTFFAAILGAVVVVMVSLMNQLKK
jgi:deoxycytidine triphosphate deaminase